MSEHKGIIHQIIGPVIDVKFGPDIGPGRSARPVPSGWTVTVSGLDRPTMEHVVDLLRQCGLLFS